MMNEKYMGMVELGDEVLANITGGKGYYGSRFKLLKKKAIVNFFYWLLFDDKPKKKKANPVVVDNPEYDDDYDDYDDYDY